MNSKKWVTCVLSTAFILGAMAPAISANDEQSRKVSIFGEQIHEVDAGESRTITAAVEQKAMESAEISKEKAIEIAKKAVTIPNDYTQQGVSFHSNWRGQESVWQIEWRKESRQNFHEIRVTVNASTGEISGISIWNHTMDSEPAPFPPKYDFEEAVEIAKDYINSVFPNKTEELFLDPNSKGWFESQPFRDRGYVNIRFHQTVNGIPFDRNSVSVAIDGNGKVQHFDYNWFENVEFESPEGIISQQDADNIFSDSIEMELRYLYEPYRMSGENDVQLAYVPKTEDNYRYYFNWFRMLNAKTGKWVQPDGVPVLEAIEVPNTPLANSSQALPDYGGETLTQDQALERIKSTFNIPTNIEFTQANFYENSHYDGLSIWSFNFQEKDRGIFPSFVRAEVNAKTGEVIHFGNDMMWRMHDEGKDFNVNISREAALKKASEFVINAAAHKADRLYATAPNNHYYNNDEKPRFYNVYFIRKENGIPVQGQGVEVTISTETGDVVEYRLMWNDIKLPKAEQVITVDEAKQLFIKDTNFGLNYHTIIPLGEINQTDREAIVVYQPSHSPIQKYLDAVTGVWMNSETGKPLYDSQEATDIAGHWAEAALKAMVTYDILDVEDGKLNPNSKLTKAELIEMFVKAVGDRHYYNDREASPFTDVAKEASYYRYIQQAVQRDLIDRNKTEFNPDELVNREYMAVLVTKSLGYDKLAQVDGLFNVDFKDHNEVTAKGHVGLVHKLGIMQGGSDGKFMPNKAMTKAEAAMTLYRFLEKRSEF